MIKKSEIQPEEDGIVFCYYDSAEKYAGDFLFVDNTIWDLEIFPEFRGNRYCEKMLGEFFDLTNQEKVILWVDENNHVAKHIYEKIGFQYTGISVESKEEGETVIRQMEIISMKKGDIQ